MEGHGPVNDQGVAVCSHVGVHAGPGQAEHHGLIPHNGLVVALHIGHRSLAGPAQTQTGPDLLQVPVLVPLVFHQMAPQVRQSHAQPVVKAQPALGQRQPHAGHPGHVLRQGDGGGVHLPDQLVGQLKVDQGVGIYVVGEVAAVLIEGVAQAVVPVEHGGDAVKAEAVQVVLLQPVF